MRNKAVAGTGGPENSWEIPTIYLLCPGFVFQSYAMRAQNQLLTSRTEVRSRFALIPLEGIPNSRLPHWPNAAVRVLASPALGASFVQYLIDLERGQGGQHTADGRVEHFLYILNGNATLTIDKAKHKLTAGSFALVPPTSNYMLQAGGKVSMLLLRKVYEPAPDVAMFAPLVGNQADVAGTVFCNDPGAILQLLIPDEWQYDIAMNIFTFEVGHSLPVVETHVMEHGLYFLEGKGCTIWTITGWRSKQRTSSGWARSAPKVFTRPVQSRRSTFTIKT